LKLLGEDYLQLLVDPGLVNRMDHFIDYGKNRKHQNPWELRNLYSTSLGKTTFYRSIAITGQEQLTIQQKGLLSKFLRKKNLTDNDLSKAMTTSLIDNFRYRVYAPYQFSSDEDSLLSVSKFPFISNGVANHWANDNNHILQYKIELPKLDVIYPECRSDAVLWEPNPLFSSSVESFVPIIINANEITQVKRCSTQKVCINPLFRIFEQYTSLKKNIYRVLNRETNLNDTPHAKYR
ncbi:hypothetical protein OAB57_02725, partial [Bacteriovoracaceae bacterium]|nr:hypothetical protein [Bacteriovoracaceae bacterium]